MEYIRSAKEEDKGGCFLCPHGTSASDEEVLVLARMPSAFMIMNKYPYSNGHVMVVPNRHTGFIEDLTDHELLDMMSLVRIISVVLKETLNAEGLNIGVNMGKAAGAGLEDHIHIHVVPRWFGDTNFMPVVGDTKVISEYLHETYSRLKESIGAKIF